MSTQRRRVGDDPGQSGSGTTPTRRSTRQQSGAGDEAGDDSQDSVVVVDATKNLTPLKTSKARLLKGRREREGLDSAENMRRMEVRKQFVNMKDLKPRLCSELEEHEETVRTSVPLIHVTQGLQNRPLEEETVEELTSKMQLNGELSDCLSVTGQ